MKKVRYIRRKRSPPPWRSPRSKNGGESDVAMWTAVTIIALAGIAGMIYVKVAGLHEESLYTFFLLILVTIREFGRAG
ncbi:MAG: hypothetical protein JO036_16345 [Candidatus Eremiobacteraeota bacterium]|nr:hypothetical protein [Candidatus Eremiobacteraeota bacterium]